MSNEEILKQCLEQEAKYQFDSISHEDVWRLGHILVELGNAQEKPVAVEVQVNGLTMFSFYPDGTSPYYQYVLKKKHTTVNLMNKSSLRFWAENQISGLDPEKDMFLDGTKMQFRGGAFPIRLKGGCVVGSIAVSGMAHTDDHALIIAALDKFFNEK